jgi:hypothetical protein
VSGIDCRASICRREYREKTFVVNRKVAQPGKFLCRGGAKLVNSRQRYQFLSVNPFMPTARTKKSSIQQIKDKVLDRVWETEVSKLTRFKRLIHGLIKMFLMVARDFIEKLVKLQAMALAFKTLLSLAPLLAVVFAVLKS